MKKLVDLHLIQCIAVLYIKRTSAFVVQHVLIGGCGLVPIASGFERWIEKLVKIITEVCSEVSTVFRRPVGVNYGTESS